MVQRAYSFFCGDRIAALNASVPERAMSFLMRLEFLVLFKVMYAVILCIVLCGFEIEI